LLWLVLKRSFSRKIPGPPSLNARPPASCRLTKIAKVTVSAAVPAVSCRIDAHFWTLMSKGCLYAKSIASAPSAAASTPAQNQNRSPPIPAVTASMKQGTKLAASQAFLPNAVQRMSSPSCCSSSSSSSFHWSDSSISSISRLIYLNSLSCRCPSFPCHLSIS